MKSVYFDQKVTKYCKISDVTKKLPLSNNVTHLLNLERNKYSKQKIEWLYQISLNKPSRSKSIIYLLHSQILLPLYYRYIYFIAF